MATYGNTAWNGIGVATWSVGLAIQLGAFSLWLHSSRREDLER
jgi:hypothetical protein